MVQIEHRLLVPTLDLQFVYLYQSIQWYQVTSIPTNVCINARDYLILPSAVELFCSILIVLSKAPLSPASSPSISLTRLVRTSSRAAWFSSSIVPDKDIPSTSLDVRRILQRQGMQSEQMGPKRDMYTFTKNHYHVETRTVRISIFQLLLYFITIRRICDKSENFTAVSLNSQELVNLN